MGVGEAKENAKLLDAAIADMELVTGQKAIATKAKNLSLTSKSERVCRSDVKLL